MAGINTIAQFNANLEAVQAKLDALAETNKAQLEALRESNQSTHRLLGIGPPSLDSSSPTVLFSLDKGISR